MSRTKSKSLPHSLYSELKREIARRANRVAELERALELAHGLKAQHVVSLTAALDKAKCEKALLTTKIQTLLSINDMRNNRIVRQNYEIELLHKRAASKSKAMRQWRTVAWVGAALAVVSAAVELVGWVM